MLLKKKNKYEYHIFSGVETYYFLQSEFMPHNVSNESIA
jgi:hypothetical protein